MLALTGAIVVHLACINRLWILSVAISKIPSMAKTINVSYQGESAVFAYKPIDRGVLYGKRRRVPFDGEGNECAKASLL